MDEFEKWLVELSADHGSDKHIQAIQSVCTLILSGYRTMNGSPRADAEKWRAIVWACRNGEGNAPLCTPIEYIEDVLFKYRKSQEK